MEVVRLTEAHKQQYSDFVAAHPSGSFLQSWTWGDFQNAQDKEAVRYGVYDLEFGDEKNLVATIQLLKTKVPHMPGFYLYSPYGPLIHNDADEHELIPALLKKIENDFATAWFIRIEPKDDLPIDGQPSIHIQPGSSLFTDLTLSEEELLSGMHQKTRYNIKVAEKHNVQVTTSSLETLDEALNLLVATSKRQGYKAQGVTYYKELLEFFKNSNGDCVANLYQAIYENKCVASAIMIDCGLTRVYLFGGSSDENKNVMAPYALHWEAMLDAKAAGMTSYDWWGIETASGTTPGFVQFKLRWGGTQKFYAGARDVVLNSRWYLAYKALRKVNRLF